MKNSLLSSLGTLLITTSIQAQTIDEGLKFIEMEQFENAKKVFVKNFQLNPSAENYYYMGNFYLTIENQDSAKYYFKKGIETDIKYGSNYVGLGAILWANKDTASASKNFTEAISMRKRDAMTYYNIAKVCLENDIKDPNKAISMIDLAIKYDKTKSNVDFYLTKGDAFLVKNDGSGAITNYNLAQKLDPKSAKVFIKRGKIYIRSLNYTEALKLYNEGISLDPGFSPAHRELAELYFKAGRFPEALSSYKKYMDLSDNSLDTKYRYGKFLFLAKDYNNTIKCLTEIQAKKPNDYIFDRLIGYSYYEMGDLKNSTLHLNQFFTKADPSKYIPSDYKYLGLSQFKSGKDTVEALKNIRKASELDSNLISLHGEIADMFYKNKTFKKAAEQYEILVAVNKANTNEYLNLGKCYYYDKMYSLADTTFSKFIIAKPKVSNGYIWKARTTAQLDPEYKQGKIKTHLDKYIEIVTGTGDVSKVKKELIEAYLYLSSYYLTFQKDKEAAKANWAKVLELDPENATAKEGLTLK